MWSAFTKNTTEGLHKIHVWLMEDVFAILPTSFGKSLIFQLFPTLSPMNGKGDAISTIMVVCQSFEAIMKES